MNFNKACAIEDFSDPELSGIMRDVCSYVAAEVSPIFPLGAEDRKDWEAAMAVRTLRRFRGLGPDATVLGVAAGTQDTLFYLTHHARQVFATDRYFAADPRSDMAPVSMLLEPRLSAPYDFDRRRLVVQHMDARELQYPDATFDGIFSSGSIQHLGELLDVAHAAYEMGRVLKPGGILSVSAELLISGPPEGSGLPGTLLLSPFDLRRYVIEASGLRPVDDLGFDVSDATMATKRDIKGALEEYQRRLAGHPNPTREMMRKGWDYPHIVMLSGDYVFTSIHLALEKGEQYPLIPNRWARPGPAMRDAVRGYNLSQLRALQPAPEDPTSGERGPDQGMAGTPRLTGINRAHDPGVGAESAELVGKQAGDLADSQMSVRTHQSRLAEAERAASSRLAELDNWDAVIDARLTELLHLSERINDRLEPSDVIDTGLWPASWTECRVALPSGETFTIVVDSDMEDPLTEAYLSGDGDRINADLIGLMLELTRPGEWVLDLGAFLGSFALAAAASGRAVIAVEASPRAASLLRASCSRNGFSSIIVVEAAAVASPGDVGFAPHGPWGWVARPGEERSAVTVRGLRVADIVAELGSPPLAFIKMDIEGSEVSALDGMSDLLAGPDAPPMLYEVNCHTLAAAGSDEQTLLQRVSDLGYASYFAEYPRLIRFRPTSFCPQTLSDLLAVKQVPDRLVTWRTEPTMTRQEQVSRIVVDCSSHNPDCRVSMARRLATAGTALLEDPRVAGALLRLREDPAIAVRDAASWFRATSPDTPATAPEPSQVGDVA